MDVLITTYLAWIVAQTGLSVPDHPRIHIVTSMEMAVRYGSPENSGLDLQALYDPSDGSIYLPQGWRPDDLRQKSTLVHELVHHARSDYELDWHRWLENHQTMKDGPDISRVAAMMGDPARANMLMALMSGMTLTSTSWPARQVSRRLRPARICHGWSRAVWSAAGSRDASSISLSPVLTLPTLSKRSSPSLPRLDICACGPVRRTTRCEGQGRATIIWPDTLPLECSSIGLPSAF